MSFPDNPLKIVTELMVDGAWQDISADVYNRDPVTITRGRSDEGAAVDPGSAKLTLNNGVSKVSGVLGRYSPRNPRSDLYGKFGRNSLLRVSVREGSPFLDTLDGIPDSASTPNVAAIGITGDIDVRWEGEADWYAPGAQTLMGKWGVAGQRSWHLRIENGLIYFHTTQDGTVGRNHNWPLPENLPKRAAFRVTMDVANPDGNTEVHFYWSDSMDGTWLDFSGVNISTGSIAIFNGTSPLTMGPQQTDSGITTLRLPSKGRTYRAEVRSGINGTVVAAPNFEAQTLGATAFTDSAGRAWSVPAGISNRRVRFVGEVSEWPTQWSAPASDGSDGYVTLTASGILRRLGQGQNALDSTLRRRVPSFKPVAYWPLEDGRDSTQAVNLVPGGKPATLTNVDWASVDSLASSKALPSLHSNGSNWATLYAPIPPAANQNTGSWYVQWVYRNDTINTAGRTYMRLLTTGTHAEWLLVWGQGKATIWTKDADGNTVFQDDWAISDDLWGRWFRVQFSLTQTDANNLHYQLAWTDVGGDIGSAHADWPGKIGRPTAFASPEGGFSPDLDGTTIGHLSAWDAWTTTNVASYDRAIDAWTGETAGARMQRIAQEESLPVLVVDGVTDQSKVGTQGIDTALTLLQDAADVDGGILYEQRNAAGLYYRGRASLYNQRPRLELDFNARGLVTPLMPVDDDQNLRNDRTVTRQNGSSARATKDTGPMSVADVGRYDDSTTLNLFTDDQAISVAGWLLHLGTYDEARYPEITVDLTRAPNLISDAADLDIGDRLTVANPPEWLPPGVIDQQVQGYQERLSLTQWAITYNCTPQGIYQVAEVDGRDEALGEFSAARKVGTDGTSLTKALTATATTLDAHMASGPNWIQSAPPITPNPLVLGGSITGWNGSGCTVMPVLAPNPPAPSPWAVRMVPNGVATTPNAFTTRATGVIPGNSYVVSGWVRTNVARNVAVNLNWYVGTTYNSTSNNSANIPANQWTWFEKVFTAPASVDGLSVAVTLGGTPPATQECLIQNATIRPVLGPTNAREFPISVTIAGEELRVNGIQDYADTFQRTRSNGWGTADYGDVWSSAGGSAADFSVNGVAGVIAHSNINQSRLIQIPAPSADVLVMGDVATPVLALGQPLFGALLARYNPATGDRYMCRLAFNTDQTMTLAITAQTAAGTPTLASATIPGLHIAGTYFRIKFEVVGTTLRAKSWRVGADEPGDWQVTTTSTLVSGAGSVGFRTIVATGSTNTLPVQYLHQNFKIDSYQRFSVDRAVNAVSKAQAAGAPVKLTRPAIVAL